MQSQSEHDGILQSLQDLSLLNQKNTAGIEKGIRNIIELMKEQKKEEMKTVGMLKDQLKKSYPSSLNTLEKYDALGHAYETKTSQLCELLQKRIANRSEF